MPRNRQSDTRIRLKANQAETGTEDQTQVRHEKQQEGNKAVKDKTHLNQMNIINTGEKLGHRTQEEKNTYKHRGKH